MALPMEVATRGRGRPKKGVATIDPEAALWVIERELADRKLYNFVRLMWPVVNPFSPFVDNWHIECICEHLEALTARSIKRLIINVPPRHGKSLIVSVFWPCWVWLRRPSAQWIYASYSSDLAERDSNRCRDLIGSRSYQDFFRPNWKIRVTQNSKEWFVNTASGSRLCTTPEGKGTGLDADFIVADDPNNARERRNNNKLWEVAEWWSGTMSTRGNDPETLVRLIIQQRISENDLTGYQIANDMGYEHLVLPARYEPHRIVSSMAQAKAENIKHPIIPTKVQQEVPAARDPRSEEGELLWPGRFTQAAMAELEKELVSATEIAGQLQQAPSPAKGSIFQETMFKRFQVEQRGGELGVLLMEQDGNNVFYFLSDCRMFQVGDTAMKTKQTNDYTVIGTMLLTPKSDLLVWDIWRERIEIPYQLEALKSLRIGPTRWLPENKKFMQVGSWPRPLLFQAIEDKSSGIGLIQTANSQGIPLKPVKADVEKGERAGPVATMYYLGKVYHHYGHPWLRALEAELLAFPTGAHDDQVDVMGMAGYLMTTDILLRSYLEGELVSDKSPPGSASAADRQTFEMELTSGEKYSVTFDDND